MLYLFYEGGQPIGIFDYEAVTRVVPVGIDEVQGGMIGQLSSVNYTGGVVPLGDGFDEYGAGGLTAVKTTIKPATDAGAPLLILDDGSTGYGTMFGHQFGTETNVADYKYFHSWHNGNLVGPNTLRGSGKVTGWITPGIYGTDYYVYEDFTFDTPPSPGDALTLNVAPSTATAPTSALGLQGTPLTTQQVYFVSFLGDPSLVSTSFVDPIGGSQIGGDTNYPILLFMWK